MSNKKIVDVPKSTFFREAEHAIVTSNTWGDCKQCKQSATGRYAGKLGCSRCGWNAGIFVQSTIKF